MPHSEPVLIVAATSAELRELAAQLSEPGNVALPYGSALQGKVYGSQVILAWLGVGKVNTAAGLALAITSLQPRLVIQIGIGGAFDGSGLEPGVAAVADEEVHLDLGARSHSGFEDLESLGFPLLELPEPVYNRIPLNAEIAEELAAGRSPIRAFGTAETVTGTPEEARFLAERFRVAVESMEGAAAAQVCLALRVPFAEARGISNAVGDRNKGNWRVGPAVTAVSALVANWLERSAG